MSRDFRLDFVFINNQQLVGVPGVPVSSSLSLFRYEVNLFRYEVKLFRYGVNLFRYEVNFFRYEVNLFRYEVNLFRSEVNLFRDELKFCCGGASFLAAPAILPPIYRIAFRSASLQIRIQMRILIQMQIRIQGVKMGRKTKVSYTKMFCLLDPEPCHWLKIQKFLKC